jgi:sRNA-binding protein
MQCGKTRRKSKKQNAERKNQNAKRKKQEARSKTQETKRPKAEKQKSKPHSPIILLRTCRGRGAAISLSPHFVIGSSPAPPPPAR